MVKSVFQASTIWPALSFFKVLLMCSAYHSVYHRVDHQASEQEAPLRCACVDPCEEENHCSREKGLWSWKSVKNSVGPMGNHLGRCWAPFLRRPAVESILLARLGTNSQVCSIQNKPELLVSWKCIPLYQSTMIEFLLWPLITGTILLNIKIISRPRERF